MMTYYQQIHKLLEDHWLQTSEMPKILVIGKSDLVGLKTEIGGILAMSGICRLPTNPELCKYCSIDVAVIQSEFRTSEMKVYS